MTLPIMPIIELVTLVELLDSQSRTALPARYPEHLRRTLVCLRAATLGIQAPASFGTHPLNIGTLSWFGAAQLAGKSPEPCLDRCQPPNPIFNR